MDPIAEYAQELAREDSLRVIGGTVVEAVDGTHVRVEIGGRAVTAYGSGAVGSAVRLVVGRGTCEVLGSPGGSDWTAPTLTGGWVVYGSDTAPPAYRRESGTVRLRGAVKSGTGDIFTLPADLRPSAGNERFTVPAGAGAANVDVRWDGAVRVISYLASGTNAYVSLAGIHYSIS